VLGAAALELMIGSPQLGCLGTAVTDSDRLRFVRDNTPAKHPPHCRFCRACRSSWFHRIYGQNCSQGPILALHKTLSPTKTTGPFKRRHTEAAPNSGQHPYSNSSGALSPVLLVFASHVRLDRGRLRARAPGASRLLRMTAGFSLHPSGSSASLRSAPATVTSFAHWIFYT
jgi:hypothetical protein